mgnify:CR=1 FL=1
MLYEFLFPFAENFQFFNVFKYITFRTGGAINICKDNLIFPFKPEDEFLDSLIQSSIIPTEPKPTIISNTVQTN